MIKITQVGTFGFTVGTQEDMLKAHQLYSKWGSSMEQSRSAILAAALLVTMTAGVFAQNEVAASKQEAAMPKVGDMAPDFTLMYFDGNDRKPIKLSDYRGKKNVIVAFYVFAFTGG